MCRLSAPQAPCACSRPGAAAPYHDNTSYYNASDYNNVWHEANSGAKLAIISHSRKSP